MAGRVFHFSVTPGTTIPLQATTSLFGLHLGLQVKAATGNTGTIWLGATSNVTAGSTATTNLATNGYPLAAGDSVLFPCATADQLWLLSPTTSQQAYLFGQ